MKPALLLPVSRPTGSRSSLALGILLTLVAGSAFAGSAFAGSAVVDRVEGNQPFQAAILCQHDGGGGRLAILQRGTPIQVLGPGAGRFFKVHVPPSPGVSPVQAGWASSDRTGWLSRVFIRFPGQAPGPVGKDPILLPGGMDGVPVQAPPFIFDPGQLPPAIQSPIQQPIPIITGGKKEAIPVPTLLGIPSQLTESPHGFTPGSDPWGGTPPALGPAAPGVETPAPQGPVGTATGTGVPVYYMIFAGGDDEAYFEAVALRGGDGIRDLGEADARAAMAASGLSGTPNIVTVRIDTWAEFSALVQQGRMPPQVPAVRRTHTLAELVATSDRILGFTIISHGGQDGPFFDYHNGKGTQSSYNWFVWDRQAGTQSLYARLVPGARLRFAGCNTANDHMWYERQDQYASNPSVTHGTAFWLQDKKVVTYGKYNSEKAGGRSFVSYQVPAGGTYPVRHGIPKASYKFGTPHASRTYENIVVQYSSAAEKAAYEDWYRRRGVTLAVSGNANQGRLTARVPRPNWVTRDSTKPAPLVAVIQALAGTAAQGQDLSAARAELQAYAPSLAHLADDPLMKMAIRDSLAANNGQLDINDFRLWAVVYQPGKWYTTYRADICDDSQIPMPRLQ